MYLCACLYSFALSSGIFLYCFLTNCFFIFSVFPSPFLLCNCCFVWLHGFSVSVIIFVCFTPFISTQQPRNYVASIYLPTCVPASVHCESIQPINFSVFLKFPKQRPGGIDSVAFPGIITPRRMIPKEANKSTQSRILSQLPTCYLSLAREKLKTS